MAPSPPLARVLATALALLAGVLLLAASTALTEQARLRHRLAVEAALPLRLAGAADLAPWPPRRVTLYLPDRAEALAAWYRRLEYRLPDVRTGADVPRVYATALPADLDAVEPLERRKSLFLRAVLPLVLRENERLHHERERLLRLRDALAQGRAPDDAGRAWLEVMAAEYRTAPDDLAALLRRVDEIPPSLALAQAATESGWGTSRFVREGNALFGMWTWAEDVPGIVPRQREDGARHRVRAFATLEESVRAYMHTLNTHRAYREFRLRRERQRRAGGSPEGLALARALGPYSEQRRLYAAALHSVIRSNALHALDDAALHGAAAAVASAAPPGAVSAPGLLGSPALIVQEPGR